MASTRLTSTDLESQLSELLNRALLLDLEITRSGRVRHIGAVRNDNVFEKKEIAGSSDTLMVHDLTWNGHEGVRY